MCGRSVERWRGDSLVLLASHFVLTRFLTDTFRRFPAAVAWRRRRNLAAATV